MVSKVDIPLSGPSLNIVRRGQANLTKIILSKYHCGVTISGVDLEDAARPPWLSRSFVVPEKRYEVTLDSGVVVSVWKADLAKFPVDAVVNAANEHLEHIGGLAYALSQAGGPCIQQDSKAYVRAHGPVDTGNAVIMDAGLLPCKKIIHAVGPRLSRRVSDSDLNIAEHLLSQTVCSVIHLVEMYGLHTVAIPAISSGIFNFPLQECAETIVRSLRYARSLKEIQLVNNDEITVRAMELACQKEFEKYQYTRGASSRSTKKTTSSDHFGNAHVTVKSGLIECEQTDVIVNATSRARWTGGLVSKAILQKAGYGMESELKKTPPEDLVVTTEAFKLNCKQVYHIILPASPEHLHHDEFLQTLQIAVLHCLEMASKSHRSISFPAIGTGNKDLRKKVARVMSEAVTEFAKDTAKKLDVYFVIHQSQEDTFKAFEEELSRAQQKAPRENSLHGQGLRDEHASGGVSSPHISLTGASDEAQQEAQRWLKHLLLGSSQQVSVCNNFILHLGEKEQKQLRQIARGGVSVEESFDNGQAKITVLGNSPEDVAVAALQVEAMLCDAVGEFVRQEERLLSASAEPSNFKNITLSPSDPECWITVRALQGMGLETVKVEKVLNPTMRLSFDRLKQLLACGAPRKMFQCVPAHFCDVVCRVGFHVECAPPDEPEHGEGIYFAGTVKKALEVWKLPSQEYVYFVEAEVLTGDSTPGRCNLIVPPVLDTNPARRYHSVSGGPDVSVIFDGRQALPTKIFTCKM